MFYIILYFAFFYKLVVFSSTTYIYKLYLVTNSGRPNRIKIRYSGRSGFFQEILNQISIGTTNEHKTVLRSFFEQQINCNWMAKTIFWIHDFHNSKVVGCTNLLHKKTSLKVSNLFFAPPWRASTKLICLFKCMYSFLQVQILQTYHSSLIHL